MRTVRSSEAEQRYCESNEKETSETPSSCPESSARREKSAVDQIRMVLSAEAEAIRFPSGENLTEETARLCPESVR